MARDTPKQIEFLNLSIADDTEISVKNPWRTLLTRLNVSTYRDLLAKSYFEIHVTPAIGHKMLAALLDRAVAYDLYQGTIPRTEAEARDFIRTSRGRKPLRET